MTTGTIDAVAELLAQARTTYDDDPTATELLEQHARRSREPLRIAIVGMVKAGKSTLLNAIIGEDVAATDAGECTRIVTWYRYGDTRRVTVHPLDGPPRAIPVRRRQGRLVFDLGDLRAEDVSHLVVDWPAKALRAMTLIDTPGMASLSSDVSQRTTDFLLPTESAMEPDAIVYLVRHLHAEDLKFLEAYREATGGDAATVNAAVVLSRADEIGSGRIDALLSAAKVAERYRHDATLDGLGLDVIPVAGLLAQSARSLKQAEYAALAELAALGKADREAMLLSAARFARPTAVVTSTPALRAALVERFGLFGVRFSAALIRGGAPNANALSKDLARRSGLHELLDLIGDRFQGRAEYLKSRAALAGVEAIAAARPRDGADELLASIERIRAGAHEYRELRTLGAMRTTRPSLSPELEEEARRLIGGSGVAAHDRLGLTAGSDPASLAAQASEALERWRSLALDPLVDHATVEVGQVVVRSCEALVHELVAKSVDDGVLLLVGSAD